MSDGVKTNGQITRDTMASGNAGSKRRNQKPRVNSPAGIKVRADRRTTTYEPRPGSCEGRLIRGYNEPGSRNPRKVGR